MAFTLSRLGVPLATGQNDGTAANQGLLMPKLKYRFRVTMTNFGVSGTNSAALTKQVMNVTRPGVQFDNIELHSYNSKVNYAGRYTWNDLTLVIRDDAGNELSKLVAAQVQKQFDFFEMASAASGIDYKFKMKIEILDGGNGSSGSAGGPTVIETFECYGCYLQNTVYSNVDYSSSDPVDITLTIKYDNAVQNEGSSNVGFAEGLGRTIATTALATGGG